ncbi:hypothetical protein G5B32_14465 [Sphingobacterium sp. SGL-16]|uniref:Uncharacterized protein n=1 Tax=Sphingobacterium litopenaei TaxID=2763500 RepID=A0ABR7Y9L1_9SPHI|nr:hypothetical protein [Sphingobacterium litopenaei]NGM74420.1 hypothetical protein [Sphingobacterium sp. SGL-16]
MIPILISYYACSVKKKKWLFISGLVLSFFGDLFLMFSGGFICRSSKFSNRTYSLYFNLQKAIQKTKLIVPSCNIAFYNWLM